LGPLIQGEIGFGQTLGSDNSCGVLGRLSKGSRVEKGPGKGNFCGGPPSLGGEHKHGASKRGVEGGHKGGDYSTKRRSANVVFGSAREKKKVHRLVVKHQRDHKTTSRENNEREILVLFVVFFLSNQLSSSFSFIISPSAGREEA